MTSSVALTRITLTAIGLISLALFEDCATYGPQVWWDFEKNTFHSLHYPQQQQQQDYQNTMNYNKDYQLSPESVPPSFSQNSPEQNQIMSYENYAQNNAKTDFQNPDQSQMNENPGEYFTYQNLKEENRANRNSFQMSEKERREEFKSQNTQDEDARYKELSPPLPPNVINKDYAVNGYDYYRDNGGFLNKLSFYLRGPQNPSRGYAYQIRQGSYTVEEGG